MANDEKSTPRNHPYTTPNITFAEAFKKVFFSSFLEEKLKKHNFLLHNFHQIVKKAPGLKALDALNLLKMCTTFR